MKYHKDQTSIPGTPRPTLCDKCVGSLIMNIEVLWDGTYGLSSLSEKTRKSNRLQMSLQRQHFLLSYLKTLSVGPAGVRTHDLPHGSPVLNQLNQPVGGQWSAVRESNPDHIGWRPVWEANAQPMRHPCSPGWGGVEPLTPTIPHLQILLLSLIYCF